MRALDARIAKLKTQLAELEKARKVVEECEAEQLGQTFEAFGPSSTVEQTPDEFTKEDVERVVYDTLNDVGKGPGMHSAVLNPSPSDEAPDEAQQEAPAPPPNNDVTPLDEKIRAGTVDVKSLVGRTVTFAGGSQRGIALPRGTIMQIVSFKRTPYERGDPVGRYLFTLSTLQKEHAIKFKEVGSESFRLQG